MIVHLNGQLTPLEQARVSPLDRGFLFGDGIYEGLRAFDGRIVAIAGHIRRMQAGLDAIRLAWDAAKLAPLTDALLAANSLKDAFVYWQVTRGAPGPGQPVRTRRLEGNISPTIFGYCNATPGLSAYDEPPVKTAAAVPDMRWLRGKVKSISLLGSVLGAQEAFEAGAEDALMVRDGLVGEFTSANALLALPRRDGTTEVVTPSLESVPILAGVTRDVLIEACAKRGKPIVERAVYLEELAKATEVMACGTLTMITSITKVDGRVIGDGKPGPEARRLLRVLVDEIRRDK